MSVAVPAFEYNLARKHELVSRRANPVRLYIYTTVTIATAPGAEYGQRDNYILEFFLYLIMRYHSLT